MFAIFRVLFGLLFVASAVLKLFPIDYFELVLVDQLGLSWVIVPLFARILILIEFTLGVAIVFGFMLRWSLISSLLMLAVFSVYLVGQIAAGNGAENCGCFGELVPLDGPSSLIKNIIMIVLGVVLLWKSLSIKRFTKPFVAPILTILAIPALFLIVPIPNVDPDADFELDTALMVRNDPYTALPINQGDKTVVIMLAKCLHCAQLGTLISKLDPVEVEDELRIIILGKPEDVDFFIEKTGIKEFHYMRSGDTELLRAIGGKFPTVIQLKDGDLVNKWVGATVNMRLLSELLELK
ncbi:MAG: MauE/DoxX family redox-associated membrane protein [Salibacteraceae bacterium]